MADTITSIESLLQGFTDSLINASLSLDNQFKTRPELQDLPFEYHIPKMSIDISVDLTTSKGKIKGFIVSKKTEKNEEKVSSQLTMDIVAIPPRKRDRLTVNDEKSAGPQLLGKYAIKVLDVKAPFLRADKGGDSGLLQVDRDLSKVSLYEHFKVFVFPDKSIAIQTANGQYLAVQDDLKAPQGANGVYLLTTENITVGQLTKSHRFMLEPVTGMEGKVAIRSLATLNFVRMSKADKQLYADRLPIRQSYDIFELAG